MLFPNKYIEVEQVSELILQKVDMLKADLTSLRNLA